MRQPYLVTNFAGKWRAHGREGSERAGERVSAPRAPDPCEPPWSGRGRVGERGSVGEGLSVEEPRCEVRSGGLEH